MNRANVAAVIVNWNGRRYLPRCVDALAGSDQAVHIVVVDNASTDGSAEYVRAEYPNVEVIYLEENRGYAGGANAGILATESEFVMVMNADVVLTPDHLSILCAKLHTEPGIGAVQGKLLQIQPDDYLAGNFEAARTVDSAGHALRRTRMVVDIGQGMPDQPLYDRERSVFSACGAALLLRRSMLTDLAPDGEYFDESFFAYKEDIDLCWRARILGWDIRYVPSAIGYHVRGWSGKKPPPPHALPLSARRHSWKNHYLLILKNDRLPDLLLSLPFLLGWEVLRQGHALFRDRKVYRTYFDLFRLLPRVMADRRIMNRRRRVAPSRLRRWFGAAHGLQPEFASDAPMSSSRG